MVWDAENAKARIFEVPGKLLNLPYTKEHQAWTAEIDEGFMIMGTHIDLVLKQKIEEGGFIDLARLMPKDRIRAEEDHRLEMINKGGLTYCVLISDRELTNINSYIRSEQAFWIYLNIYAKANPNRVTELLQYNHVIEVAATNFAWDEVYQYDREFRMHMSENPDRNWGIILQQAWVLCLKTPAGNSQQQMFNPVTSSQQGGAPKSDRKVCFRFNRGKCTFGSRCKFDHKCGICGKFGHGAYNCRRARDNHHYQDRDRHNERGNGNDRDRNYSKNDYHHRK